MAPKHFAVEGEITGLHSLRGPAAVGNCKIARTSFHNNSTPVPLKPEDRLTIQDVAIYQCQHWACFARGVVFRDVSVTDIRGGGRAPSFLFGCAYIHVSLRGWISGVMMRWQVDFDNQQLSRRFLWANMTLYESIDWALNIEEANFSFFESLLGIPAHLVRRNARSHFVMKREAAEALLAESAEPTVWRVTAQQLIESGLPNTVIVTGGAGKKLKAQIDEGTALVDRGLLE